MRSILLAAVVFVPLKARADHQASARGESGAHPNIIFILTDDLGWGDLGVFYQNDSKHDKKHRTPHLDRLADGGLQMRAHYCPAPVCAPSRSSLLTGVHQGNAVVRNNQFDKELENNHTLGTVLQAAGYRTCMVGKYGLQGGIKGKGKGGNPENWPAYPTRRGFDEYFGYVSHVAGHLHYPDDRWEFANSGHRGVSDLWCSDESGDYEVSEALSKCYTTDLFTAKAKQFLIDHQKQRRDQPFFLMLNYDTPHAALQIPTIAYPEGGGLDGGLQWTGGNDPGAITQPAINTATGKVDSFRHPEYTGKGWTDPEERFATMVRRIDSAVGDLNQTLEELGIAENTLVVFTSDNGPHTESYSTSGPSGIGKYTPQSFQSYGPFDGIKRDGWEGGIRMPTLAWWKGTIAGDRIDSTPSQFHDWMATFCDVANIPAPARCDGVSLMPTLTGTGNQPESTVYIEYFNGGKTPDYKDFLASRQKRARREMQVIRMLGKDGISYKGVRANIRSADDDFEIYDVEADPDEAKNLADKSDAMRELQAAMKDRVLQLRCANESATRPYDDAMIPAVAHLKPGSTVVRNELPKSVSYVPQLKGDTESISGGVQSNADDGFSFSAPQAGIYQIQASVSVPKDGKYGICIETEATCFARLHQGHAIDLSENSDDRSQNAVRFLATGNHPLTITLRAENPGDTVTWSVK